VVAGFERPIVLHRGEVAVRGGLKEGTVTRNSKGAGTDELNILPQRAQPPALYST
jgi:hypothetical protein